MEYSHVKSSEYIKEIDHWVSEKKVVTFKYLSQKKQIHVNVAKMILQDYKEVKKAEGVDLSTVYLLSGIAKDGEKQVLLVTEDIKRKLTSNQFAVESDHIYSIQSAELPVSKELLSEVNNETLNLNPFGATKFTSINNPGLWQ